VNYGGQFESESKASNYLCHLQIIAIAYHFLAICDYEFKDVKLAFVVLINLPLALIVGI